MSSPGAFLSMRELQQLHRIKINILGGGKIFLKSMHLFHNMLFSELYEDLLCIQLRKCLLLKTCNSIFPGTFKVHLHWSVFVFPLSMKTQSHWMRAHLDDLIGPNYLLQGKKEKSYSELLGIRT